MMTKRHCRRLTVLLLCVQRTCSFSPQQHRALSRGGGFEENEQLDEYIEELIATVDSTSEETSSTEDETTSEEEEIQSARDTSRKDTGVSNDAARSEEEEDEPDEEETEEEESDEEKSAEVSIKQVKVNENETNEKQVEDSAAVDSVDPSDDDVRVDEEDDGEEEKGETPEEGVQKEKCKRRKKKRAQDDKDEPEAVSSNEGEQDRPQAVSAPPRRPNALYRFLLNHGRVGHVVAMICVLIVEFIQTYLPPLANLLGVVFSVFASPQEDVSYKRSASRRGPAKKVNEQYAGFVSSDGSSVRGKQRKEQVKKADQTAAEKLRRVGSVQEAKFRHVSEDFMRRHGIGPYRGLERKDELVVHDSASLVPAESDEKEESDVDWVVEALSADEVEEKSSPVETTIGVGMGSNGASISVGFQFGGTKKKRKKTLAQAATEVDARKSHAPVGPRTSDRDGGGGVMGLIRAAGANSIMSRSLLGAYPGDAVPPSEAASANGITSLAEKYGYGDWSDDDEEEDEDDLFPPPKRKRRKRKTPKHKKRSTSSGVSFEFGLSSSNTRTRTASRRLPSSSSRSRVKKKDPVAPLTTKSPILSGSKTLERRQQARVRAPMERLDTARERLKKKDDDLD